MVIQKKEVQLSNSIQIFWFVVIWITNILVNVDHGWIPACTVTLKKDLNLDNASLGVLGSVVYWGLLLGSFTSPPIFHHFNVKSIILCCILFNMFCLIGFTQFSDFVILCLFRFGVGFFQVFLWIYFPVWIDIFADITKKTIWLTILQSSVPLGVVTGYGMTAIFDQEFGNWRYSYYVQTIVYFFLMIVFFLIPQDYIEDNHGDDENSQESEIQKINADPNKIKEELPEFESGYLTSKESSDDGYEWEMSSKADISSIGFSKN